MIILKPHNKLSTITIFAFQMRLQKVNLPKGTQAVSGRSKFEYQWPNSKAPSQNLERKNK